ncbi:pilus assembly protein TadG-related protein [Sagittula sp. S175]|uniref:pilus assembly protein TadG-related protein n=1 Tax=Sagittula sp. S175 TaxID=3415129 RepID=UPI003C7C6B6E
MTMFKTQTKARIAPAARSVTGGWLGRFWGDQSGNMSYVALVGSLIMMIFGGIGIDMMNAERDRNKVQHTLDRAVLAAANLNNTRDPTTVVNDYFKAMNLEGFLDDVDPDVVSGSKRVTAVGKGTISSSFLPLIGVTGLNIDGLATAENAVAPTEISLVLDVSGSMQGAKLEQLKTAAKNFVNTVLGDGGDNSRVTVSIIPYNATVNMGPELAARYAMEMEHTFSTCGTFDDAAFDSTTFDPANDRLGQISHFDPYYEDQMFVAQPWCSTGTTSNIIAHSADPAFLNTFIESLVAEGNTAIDLGMKWGVSLLDPSAQEVVADLSDKNLAPTSAQYRPAEFGANTQKYVVVMTDGENTQQFDLREYMKDPANLSNVWVDDHGTPGTGDDRWSIRVIDNPGDTSDVFYWPHATGNTPRYQSGPYSWVLNGAAPLVNGVAVVNGDDETTKQTCSSYKGAGANSSQSTLVEGMTSIDYAALAETAAATGTDCANYPPVRLNWMELFGTVKTSYYANIWMWQAYVDNKIPYQAYYDAYYSWEEKVNGDMADNRLSRICGAAKAKGIVVYSIGVEAPERGLTAMGDCASSPAHFFDVTGSELVDTFSSISDMLVELRLTE